MNDNLFLELSYGTPLETILASYDDDTRKHLAEEIKKLGRCKVRRSIFGFLSTNPGSWGYTNYEEGDVISSYEELITLAKTERYSEKSILSDYRAGTLKIVPVK